MSGMFVGLVGVIGSGIGMARLRLLFPEGKGVSSMHLGRRHGWSPGAQSRRAD